MTLLHTIDLLNLDFSNSYPFSLAIFQNWEQLVFTSQVTFFVGENGSGKSTLLEAIACAVDSITIGSESVKTDPTLNDVRKLGRAMKLSWSQRSRRGFFLRAEDFFGYVKNLSKTRAELERDLTEVDLDYKERSEFARGLARMPYARELNAMKDQYGKGLDLQSHGESYLELFQSRFDPGGLYLLDEPEAALSPLRQLGFLSLLKEMVKLESQFVIVTHSPILMAFPGATILSFDHAPLEKVAWDQLEHVALTRDFLNSPGEFLRHL